MASRKIDIQYNIDTQDVKIAGEETMSLTQRVRILKKELQRGDLKPEQFDVLRKKIGDYEDKIKSSTVRSRNFFEVLGTLPGPLGSFGASINSVIETLKVLSSFSFKDIKNSVKDVGDDIGDITNNLAGFTEGTKNLDDTAKSASNSVGNLSDNLIEAGSQAGATGGAISSSSLNAAKEIAKLEEESTNLVGTTIDLDKALQNLKNQGFDAQKDPLKDINGKVTDLNISYTDLNGDIRLFTKSQVESAEAGKILIKTNDGIALSAEKAAVATSGFSKVLKGIIAGTVIGAVVVAIGFLIEKLISYATALGQATDEEKAATKALTDFKVKLFEVQNSFKAAEAGVISKADALKEYNDKLGSTIGFAKSLGEAEMLLAANTDTVIKSIRLKAEAQVFYAKSAEASAKAISGEGLKLDFWEKTINFIKTGGSPIMSIRADIETSVEKLGELTKQSEDFAKKGEELTRQAIELEKTLIGTRTKPTETKGKDPNEQRLADLDAMIQLEINKERTSQVELEKLLQQKFELIVKKDKLTYAQQELLRQENKKKVEDALQEDSDRVMGFIQKRNEIMINADKDEQVREESLLAEKLYFDKVAISKETEFKKKSKEEQNQIFLDMEEKYQQDLLKIKEKFFLKEFDKQKEIDKQKRANIVTEGELVLDLNQQMLTKKITLNDYLETLLLGNNKEMFKTYFVDLRALYKQNYEDTEKSLVNELDALKKANDDKKLSNEEYERRVREVNQAIIDNKNDYTQKVIQLDDLERSSRETVADRFLEVAQRVLDFTNALIDIRTANNDAEMKAFDDRLGLYEKDSEAYNKILEEKREAEKQNLKEIKKIQTAAALADAAIQIARVIIDTQRAIVSFAASVAPLGPAGVPIAAAYATASKVLAGLSIATITAQGIAKIKQIQNQDITTEAPSGSSGGNQQGRGYEKGGVIKGRRHAQGGTIIEAEDGEAIMTRGAVTLFRPMLSMMNQMGGGTSFNTPNGIVTLPDSPAVSNPVEEQSPVILKTYVVENELTSIQQRQARLKDLSTL